MEEYIQDILEKNNRVIIPELGAFIVKQRKPLTIVFNEFLQYNDGILVDAISKKNEIDRDVAKKEVDDFVNEVKKKIEKGEKYTLKGIGSLIKSSTGKISIESGEVSADIKKSEEKEIKEDTKKPVKEPETKKQATVEPKKPQTEAKKTETIEKTEPAKSDKSISVKESLSKDKEIKKEDPDKPELKTVSEKDRQKPQSTGTVSDKTPTPDKTSKEPVSALGSQKDISSKSESPTVKRSPEHTSSTFSEYTNSDPDRKKKTLIWIIVVVILCGILGYFIIGKDIAVLLNDKQVESVVPETEDMEEPEPASTIDQAAITDQPEESGSSEEMAGSEEPLQSEPQQTISQGTRYYIVAGVFMMESNADNLVRELRSEGYNAEKFTRINDMHAVSYAVFSDKAEAQRMLRNIRSEENSEAWIKVMN